MIHHIPENTFDPVDLAAVTRALANGVTTAKNDQERNQIFHQLTTYTRQLIPHAEHNNAAVSALLVSGEAFLDKGQGQYTRHAVDALTAALKNPELPILQVTSAAQRILDGIKELDNHCPASASDGKAERLLNTESLLTVQAALDRVNRQQVVTLAHAVDQTLAGYNNPIRRMPRPPSREPG